MRVVSVFKVVRSTLVVVVWIERSNAYRLLFPPLFLLAFISTTPTYLSALSLASVYLSSWPAFRASLSFLSLSLSLSLVTGNLLTSACSRNKDAQATVKAHIKLLHDYNEIRDIGQGLMGIIADNKGVRVRDVYRDFDVGEGD